jgi:hypothetical protein
VIFTGLLHPILRSGNETKKLILLHFAGLRIPLPSIFTIKKMQKMKFRIVSFALLLTLFAGACKNDTSSQTNTTGEATSSDAATPGMDASQGAQPQGVVTDGGTIQPLSGSQGQAQPAPAGATAGAAGAVNPPHGQPGHVCGTPVGAPLGGGAAGSKGASVSTPALSPTAKPAAAPASAPAATAPGMNPPHGQPGHVCGTPVGAPLKGN